MDLPDKDAPLPETLSSAGKDETLHPYREMLRIRRFEESAAKAYTRGNPAQRSFWKQQLSGATIRPVP